MTKVAIVILNWNGWRDTVECLKSISKLQATSYKLQVVVIDNGSTDNSVEKIKRFIEKHSRILTLRLIENRHNLGFAEGNNVGIREALRKGADYVMLLNNDTLVDRNLISRLMKTVEVDKTIGIAGPKIYFAPGKEFHYHRYQDNERGKVIWYAGGRIDWENVYCSHQGVDEVDRGQYDSQEETDYTSGCCLTARREVFKKIGLLEKKYFLYFEDVDFCLRAKKAGFRVVYIPQAFLWHKNAASSGKPGSPTHAYYLTRNRLLFGMKYASWLTKLALLKESLKTLRGGGVKRKAVVDFYLQKFGQGQW